MQRQDFQFDLPIELIAQHPVSRRTDSRMLCLETNTGVLRDRYFHELTQVLQAGDLLVLNDTRVMPARVFGYKSSGGKLELLVERLLPDNRLYAKIRASKAPKPGSVIHLEDGTALQVVASNDGLYTLAGASDLDLSLLLERIGHIPLPPYIDRADNETDKARYQTVYADKPGAVAAPTAGLHFDQALLGRLQAMGVGLATVTLHVGAGTFTPVRVDDLATHVMHSEWLEVSQTTCDMVNQTRRCGGRIIAVGTTSVRCLETAWQAGELRPFSGETRIFIYPPYRFRAVDALITNFHLPESSLLMLVAAFAGFTATMTAYRHAVTHSYRFFSYGDAMFISDRYSNPYL